MNIRTLVLLLTMLPFSLQANTLIITRGPVCSGMGSYLANALQSLDDSYYSYSQNDLFNMVCYELCCELFPQHMKIIHGAMHKENIAPAIVYNHIYFKETTHPEQQLQALEAIAHIRNFFDNPAQEKFLTTLALLKNHHEMAELAYHAACKHDVIWEKRTKSNWNYDTTEIENLFDTVINVVTYCPPTTIIQEWSKKNNHAIIEKKAFLQRHLKQVLTSFFMIFQPTNQHNNVVTLTKNEFDIIIEEAAHYLQAVPQDMCGQDHAFTKSEFTLEDLFAFKEEIYKTYHFDNVESVNLAPTLAYDFLLTTKQDCLQCAHNLINPQ
jgi:hypothetical protein